jgi:cyclopropane fatty-acyl-phospholipid synthase-like methyltransferase
LTGDQLHPPMIDDERAWADGRRWAKAATEHTRAAARFSGLRPGDSVLDIGCGIGGPARTLVRDFGATVYSISTEPSMLDSARRLNQADPRFTDAIDLEEHDCQEPYARSGFDLAWSMNMIYHVPDKEALLRCAREALRPGGRIMIEDWMLTPVATREDRIELEHHFGSAAHARVDDLVAKLLSARFDLTAVADLGHVGRTHMAKHFASQMNDYFRPQLVADHGEEHGSSMAEEFVEAISATIRMYGERRMTYLRVLATRD